jgi:hypothetical protein
VDYQALLYDPIYNALGVDAVLHMGIEAGDVPLRAIDKTAGIIINQAIGLETVSPAATVRAAELAAAGVPLADIYSRTLTLNGRDWTVASWRRKPSPNGADDGEVYLILDGDIGDGDPG